MHPILNTAVKAARRAGNIIMRHSDQLDRLAIEAKGRNDFVSQVDRLAEAEIIRVVHGAYPDHAILAEESGRQQGNEYLWVIDPLDGTTNYLHGYPQFAVSIALEHRGQPQQAVVLDPVRNELYTASRGSGAQRNERRIRVSQTRSLKFSLLGTGFPFRIEEHMETWINTFRALLKSSSGVRRAGSAALDLAHVACGRLDGFWEFGLGHWDLSAGSLLIEEAGGLISDMSGGQDFLQTGNVVAGNAEIHGQMLPLIQPHLPAPLQR
ncbi:MAG: inositol monophosphatase family protein [Acidiferrobacterales bacterium]